MSFKIIVLGAGKRVRNDILPALVANGILEKDMFIIRKNYAILDDFPKIKVINDYNALKFENFSENTILVSSIPQSETIVALNRILRIVTPTTILIDTPVFKIAESIQNIKHEYGIHVNLLEDGGLIPWLDVFTKTKLMETRFFLSYRAFYLFHGVSSFRKIIGEYNFRGRSMLQGRIIHLSNDRGRDILQLGYRDYAKGRFFWFWNKKIVYLGLELKWAKMFRRISLKDILSDEDYFEFYQLIEKFNLDPDSLFDNPIKYMHDWKRIGLYIGFKNLFDGNINIFPNLKAGVSNELICDNYLNLNY